MAQSITPVLFGDLPVATVVNPNDQLAVYQDGLFKRVSRSVILKAADTAVQAATIGGVAVPKADTELQLPAYPTDRKSTRLNSSH